MKAKPFSLAAGTLLLLSYALLVQGNSGYDAKGLVHLDEEIFTLDPAAALASAYGGALTFNLRGGPMTFPVQDMPLDDPNIQYFTVDAADTVLPVEPPAIHTFQDPYEGSEAWSAFTIAPGYFGGAAQVAPDLQRVFESVGALPSGQLLVRTYAKTLQDLPRVALASASAPAAASPSGPSGPTASYSAQTLRVVLDSDARHYGSQGSSTTNVYAAQKDYLNRASATYTGISISFSVVQQWAWTSGGPTYTDCGYYRDYQSSHWSSTTHSHSSTARDIVMMFTYIRGPMTWYGSGSAGGCAFQAGLDQPLTQGYTVINTDDTSNIHWKLAHEAGHVVDADHDSATMAGYSCKVDGYNTNYWWPLMGAGTDRCRLAKFSATMEARVRNCVEDRPNC